MEELKVGDIVEYVDDRIPNRRWYLYSLSKGNLCTIVLIRNGEYMHEKHFKSAGYEWSEKYLNASIVNLDISKIKKEVRFL